MGALKQMRRRINPIWDIFDKIKLPTKCGDKWCPPGWICKIEDSGAASCLYSPPTATPMPTFPAIPATFAAPGLDWSKYWSKTSDDYRGYVNLQVFAQGVGTYAGQPPSLQAVVAGMDSVFNFVMTKVPWPPPSGANGEEKIDAAAEAALEVANEVYETDVVEAALDVLLPKWMGKYAMGFAA